MKGTNFKRRCKGLLALMVAFTMMVGSNMTVLAAFMPSTTPASSTKGTLSTTPTTTIQLESKQGRYDSAGQYIVDGKVTTPPAPTGSAPTEQKSNEQEVEDDTEQQPTTNGQ